MLNKKCHKSIKSCLLKSYVGLKYYEVIVFCPKKKYYQVVVRWCELDHNYLTVLLVFIKLNNKCHKFNLLTSENEEKNQD